MPDNENPEWNEKTLPPKDLPLDTFIHGVASVDRGHGFRVGEIVGIIADLAGITSLDRDKLKMAGKMHDAGKILIPAEILQAPRSLTAEERKNVQRHPLLGLAITQWYNHDFCEEIRDAMLLHHERWDGSGYPFGLKGKDIPLLVRIVTLADTIDAIASRRDYKAPWKPDFIQTFLKHETGKIYDPDLAKVCIDNLDKVLEPVKNCKLSH